ncbi:type-F conjugative transfer system mating-pair stabilization protein TraN [Shigella sonnei]|nr:type-F conjugative transfer system mating-pair stabilization protein TraN [Shigella sonnei]EKS2279208.1 type-F conjugative transfer system mating-pair stabilization protein TraN [Shigella sonnei]
MNRKIFALFALTAGMHLAVHASENVNTPENRQFLKQQENLSRQLREKPDHQLKAWAEKQVLENPLQRSDNHFLDELVRKQQASQDGKPWQGALYFVSFSIPEEGLKRMLGETRHYGIPATLRGMVNNDLKTTAEAVLSLVKDGTTEWATGETGKTITESFMNKPKDILSPDAPFIQTGRDVVNRADSIVGNTGQQCSAQEISRSEYTNYTCERDLQVEQYCTRTARMELQGSTTWETRTLEYEMSQLPAREVNGQYVVSITSPVTGEIVDAHYSWSRTYLQKSVPMTITVLGTPLSWNAKYSADASFTPVQKTLTAGVAFTSSHPVRVGNTKFRRHTAMKLRLVVRVKKASYTPYVVWSESCPFSKELGKLTKTECTEAGGNRTLVKDGQSYSMYQSCWAYRDTYVTQSADKGTCQTYTDNPACTLVSHQCAFYSEEGACLHEYATYSCESKTSGKVMVCGGDVFCLDGECDKAQSGKSNDFAEAVSQLAALAAAGKDVAALNGVDVRAFTGQAKFCKKAAAGYSNCCKDSGWGQDIGLAKCSSDEKALAKAKSDKLTVSVGEFCSKKVPGVCLEKKRSYCQFDSKLAQIVQQQGRNGQLRISFGSAKHPDCRGITVDELQKIQFDRLDFTNFYEDLMNNQKIPDSGVLTQKVKEQIADQLKQAGQ